MATKKQNKSAVRDTKAEGLVRLGSDELLSNEQIDARYPICKEAQEMINAFKAGIDESSLYYLTDCFRGFSREMQLAMVEFFLDVFCGRMEGESWLSFTGVKHVDLLLLSVLDKIDHDTKNLEGNL